MAGVLLFITKKPKQTTDFQHRIRQLRHFLNANYQQYFPNIHFVYPAPDTCLILFENDNEEQFYSDPAGNWLVVEGNVFALSGIKKFSASELWTLYKKHHSGFVNLLDGHFVIKLFDTERNQYIVTNDFISSRHNYFCETDNYIMITPFLISTAVIKIPVLDWHALNEILWRYYILSERTLLDGIKRLPPSSILTINNDATAVQHYWRFPDNLTTRKLPDLVDSLVESILDTAHLIGDNFKSIVSDLTLGQDSRLLVAAFMKENLPIITTTFGREDFLEVQGARRLAERHQIPNHNIRLSDRFLDNLWAYFQKAILLGNGDESGYLLGRILFMREEQAEFGDALVNGAGGPFYKDCFWEEIYIFNLYRESTQLNPKRFLQLRPMNKPYNDSLFTPDFLKIKQASAEYFLDMFNRSNDGYEHCPISMQIDNFALTKWQNYAVFSNSTANSLYNSFSPLLFRKNLDLSLPVPAKYRWNKSRLQREMMFQINPALAREKTDFGGINMVPNNAFTFLPFYLRYAYKQSERYRNKIKNRLHLNTKTWLQKAWDYTPVYRSLFHQNEHKQLLNYNNLNIAPIIKSEAWEQLLRSYESPTSSVSVYDYEFLFKLTSIEYFLKMAAKLHSTVGNNN